MRKSLLLVTFVAYCLTYPLGAQAADSLLGVVPTMGDASALFRQLTNLQTMDETGPLDENWLASAYDACLTSDELGSLAFLEYLRSARSPMVRSAVRRHIEDLRLEDPLSRALLRLYDSEPTTVGAGESAMTRYSYRGELFDEGIDLFHLTDYSLFESQLHVSVPKNPWQIIRFTDKASGRTDPNTVVLQIPGGPTHSMYISFSRQATTNEAEFREFASTSTLRGRCGSAVLQDATGQGVLGSSGADLVFVETCSGVDSAFGIQQAIVRLTMYSAARGMAYAVEWYMNFSAINNNYEIRHRLWKYMAKLATLTYLE